MCLLILWCAAAVNAAAAADSARPNIVYVLCDDLGYGDVRALNPEGKIPTPNFDRVAAEGMSFTDVHSGSAVCTPTRYGIVTGRYAWRSRLQRGVLGGLSPTLIRNEQLTVPKLLKSNGYSTACIGKWHLGMDWTRLQGKDVSENDIETSQQVWNVEFSKPVTGGPNSAGFDYYFGISASLDMVPYTFIENDRVAALPTENREFPLMFGRTDGATRKGPAAPGFEAEDMLPTLTKKAVEFLEASSAKEQPFFLYLPLASPHTPILPKESWRNKSGLNPYADFVMQTDASLGEVMAAMDRLHLADNTLLIVTSDNGCSPQARFEELAAKGHNPSFRFRGNKADIFEGGHRIPFLVRWPGQVRPGTRCDQLLCLTDLLATCADLLKAELPSEAGVDSVSFLPALRGTADKPLREAVVHHSINGSFAIRRGNWKLALCADSGGWSSPRPNSAEARGLPDVQLYDLASDIGEQHNVQAQHPDVVASLTALLEEYVADGRSTPGPVQSNDAKIQITRPLAAAAGSSEKTRPKANRKRAKD